MTTDRTRTIAKAMEELLIEHGPLSLEDVRARLCVASMDLMRAGVRWLMERDIVEHHKGGPGVYRIAGDTRKGPSIAEFSGHSRSRV